MAGRNGGGWNPRPGRNDGRGSGQDGRGGGSGGGSGRWNYFWGFDSVPGGGASGFGFSLGSVGLSENGTNYQFGYGWSGRFDDGRVGGGGGGGGGGGSGGVAFGFGGGGGGRTWNGQGLGFGGTGAAGASSPNAPPRDSGPQ